jgi:diguanylate cyclase (GGDEF)-like protein
VSSRCDVAAASAEDVDHFQHFANIFGRLDRKSCQAVPPGLGVRLLIVEDSEDDARLLYSELVGANRDISHLRVDCAGDMRAALAAAEWDIVISDHNLPRFSSLEALSVLKESGKDIPFIIYSGVVSEHVAVAAMRSGARDSIPKGNFARLLPAIDREIQGAAIRREKQEADHQAHQLAFYDSLTGLPNRNLFCSHISQELSRAEGNTAAVYMLDIDRFLRINNCFGYKVGDALIRQIGQRLQASVPAEGMVARVGSDEFAVFLGDVENVEDVRNAAEKMRAALAKPFIEGAFELYVTASIGMALAPRDGEDMAELLINAESALFRAKDLGGNNYQFYTHEMCAASIGQMALEGALRRAIENDQLILEYQPNVDAVTGRMTGVEALVRWDHPERGLLPPNEFIPLANESGLIIEIGKWVLQRACRQGKAWHDAGYPGLTIAVNVSPVQFWQPGLVQIVGEVLAETGIRPDCVELEITESVLMQDAEATIRTLNALKEMQVKISIDDFGTGYSSLSYLKRFPIDILKIDKSFSCDVMCDDESAAIVQAITALARSLRLIMVAEGVETLEQLDFFRSQRCERVQGFLFSAPRSVADVSAMLGTHERLPTSVLRLAAA